MHGKLGVWGVLSLAFCHLVFGAIGAQHGWLKGGIIIATRPYEDYISKMKLN